MPGVMDRSRARVGRALARWKQGTVTLTRSTPGTPDPETPWIPGTPTLDVYELDAVANGVAAEYVDGTTILASDLVVVASPKARHTLTDGDPADGAVVDIVPRMSDTLKVDGATKVIKKIQPVPAAGLAARFKIFVAG